MARLGWGSVGLRGIGSSSVGVGGGSGILAWGGVTVPVLVLWWGCVFPVTGMGFCWRTWAGEDVGSGVWARAVLGSERKPAFWSCGPCEVRWVLNVFLPGASWRRAVFFSLSFGCGCVVLFSGACSFPCWRTCAAGGALARCSSLDVIIRAGDVFFLFGPGASLSWGLCLEVWLPASFQWVSFLSFGVELVWMAMVSLPGLTDIPVIGIP